MQEGLLPLSPLAFFAIKSTDKSVEFFHLTKLTGDKSGRAHKGDVPIFFINRFLPFMSFPAYPIKMKNRAPLLCQVSLHDINLSDMNYSLNPFHQPLQENLLKSINNLGILHPPLLLKQQDSSFIILSGRRRIQAYLQCFQSSSTQKDKLEHDEKTLPALVFSSNGEKGENNPALLFTALVQHQLLSGSLSIIEQAVLLQKASMVLKEQEVLRLLPLLGMKPKPNVSGELVALLDLETTAQLGLHQGIIAPRSGKKLARFSLADQKQLAQLIEQFQLGGSKQQNLLDRLFQLTKRKQTSVEILISQWREKEKDKQLNGPQQVSSLLRWLDQQCQPRLKQAEDEFKKFNSQLQLPAGVRVEHALSFEEEQVTLSIDFSSKEELASIWPKIEALLQS
ncbi:MAG: ParB N-terminal domain-containing protein [Candidatus Electrothrix aestuarii]|uniref:ParB N-terminal domain-containing protein n=1 Tax=Candidatus Electrothrix aestuarii TaxID=3062594 RepID=A0AAU8M000_9BACT